MSKLSSVPNKESHPIKNFMTPDPITIEAHATLEEAMNAMEVSGIRHLPVLKDRCLVGVVSDRDLARALSLSHSHQMTEVGQIMSLSPYCVFPEEDMKNVLQVMAANRLGSVVVKTHGERVVGIFTTTDAITLLAKIFI